MIVSELTQEFLDVLDKCPSKLKKKIMTWKVRILYFSFCECEILLQQQFTASVCSKECIGWMCLYLYIFWCHKFFRLVLLWIHDICIYFYVFSNSMSFQKWGDVLSPTSKETLAFSKDRALLWCLYLFNTKWLSCFIKREIDLSKNRTHLTQR